MAKVPNLWADKKIPVLEYCSVDEASHILNCPHREMLLLARIGSITLYRELFGIEGEATLVTDNDKEDYIKDLLSSPRKYAIGAKLGFLPSEFDRVDDNVSYEKRHVLFTTMNIEAFGFWPLSYNHIFNCMASTGVFRTTSDHDGIRVIHLRLPNTQVETKDIFIQRSDMERLYISSISGKPLSSILIDQDLDAEVDLVSKERVTAKQSDYIAALMNALGISEYEMKSSSINQIKNRLSSKSGEISIPEVSEDTLADWLKRAGKR